MKAAVEIFLGFSLIFILVNAKFGTAAEEASLENAESKHKGCKLPFKCVPFEQCDDDNVINVGGQGLLDLRTAELGKSGTGNFPDFGFRALPGERLHHNPALKCGVVTDICCLDPVEKRNLAVKANPGPPICGRFRRTTYVDPVTNATETSTGECPWLCALHKRSIDEPELSAEFKVYCGASLIHPQVVLTAAHCVGASHFDPTKERLLVRMGEWGPPEKAESGSLRDRYVVQVVTHPHYKPGPYYNNLALLFLDEPFDMKSHVDTICLPKPGYTIPLGARCVAPGFGQDVLENGYYNAVLRKITMPIVEREPCVDRLRNTKLGEWFQLHPSYFCAGGVEGQDACPGYGGGPLVCEDPTSGVWIQAGIVAWGVGCSHPVPSVFTKVRKFSEWIDQEISSYEKMDTSSEYPRQRYFGYATKPAAVPGPKNSDCSPPVTADAERFPRGLHGGDGMAAPFAWSRKAWEPNAVTCLSGRNRAIDAFKSYFTKQCASLLPPKKLAPRPRKRSHGAASASAVSRDPFEDILRK